MFTIEVDRTVTIKSEPLRVIPAPVSRVPLFRILHDRELGEVRNVTESNGAPEIFRLETYHMVRFTRSWQERSFQMNPGMTPEKWTSLYSDKTVLTNEQGLGNADDPRRNYITGEDMDADELPKVASLVFGGNVLTGHVVGSFLQVLTLDASQPPPALTYILARPWLYSVGTNVSKSGAVGRLPQGSGRDVLIPLMADRTRYPVLTFPMNKLVRLADGAAIPSPYL